jgi:hypothetical protein
MEVHMPTTELIAHTNEASLMKLEKELVDNNIYIVEWREKARWMHNDEPFLYSILIGFPETSNFRKVKETVANRLLGENNQISPDRSNYP